MTDFIKDSRFEAAQAWLSSLDQGLELRMETMAPASADASFRRYFRIEGAAGTYIVMDAPPPVESKSVDAFLKIDALMQQAGMNVPRIFASDSAQGFVLMSDLGRQTYLDVLNEDNAARLMDAATDELVLWQKATREGALPAYDHAMLKREIDLFPEWYVKTHRAYAMTDKQAEKLPGVLDFQDAVLGPVSYDIASLMRDAFISWGESFVLDVTIRYWDKARKAGIAVPADFGEFWRDVEWMGMQRHLKILGIFARINYRDGKPKYLADTPRFLHYVRETANRYDELKPVNWLLDQFEEVKSKGAWTF